MTSILYNDLKTLITNNQLVVEEQYRITDYVTTVSKANYTSAGYKFDIVVTALTTNTLYEYALLMSNASETYFDAEGLLIYNIRYNVNNIIPGYDNDWVDANGKGCIYYMVDNKGNEAPFDFKNIKYNGKFLFNNTVDNTDSSQTVSWYNVVREVIEDGYFKLPQISFNDECNNVEIGTNASEVTITESSNLQIGDNCKDSEFTNVNNTLIGNELSGSTLTSIDGGKIGDNNKHIIATNHTNLIIKDKNTTITLGGGSNGVIVDSNNANVTIGTNAKDIYINASKEVILGHNIEQFNISSSYNMTVADDCKLFNLNETNHLTATTGCENINTIKNDYLTLTEEVKNVTVSERLTNLILDGTKLTGSDGKLIIKQDEKVVIVNEQTNSEVVLVEDGTTASNPNSFINDSPSDGFIYGRKDGNWEQIDTSGGSIEHDNLLNLDGNPNFLHINEAEKALITSTAGIVSEHTEAIEDLEANKANTSHTHTKSEVGLGNVDNTSDVNKPISNATQTALNGKADKGTTLADYGITDAVTQTDILYADLLNLIANDELIPSSNYRITDYTTTTTQVDTQSAGHNFDIIVTALSTNELSEDAKCVRKDSDTYFTNANLEAWEIKYCVDNDTVRFEWANASTGKGVIYRMVDEYNNECPYDFKNIQFKKSNVFLYTFGGINDNSLTGNSVGNTIKELTSSNKLSLNFNTFGTNCHFIVLGFNSNNNTFGDYCNFNTFGNKFVSNTFGNNCYSNTFGDSCGGNTLDDYCIYNTFDDLCDSNNFGVDCGSNTFGKGCTANTFGDECTANTFGDYCGNNTFGTECRNNKFGNNYYANTFGNECYSNTFGNDCNGNKFGDSCGYNTFDTYCWNNTFNNYFISITFGSNCNYNNFYHGTSGTVKKDFVKYVVLEDGCKYNNFYSTSTTSGGSYLQRIRIKGLENTTPTNTIITLPANTDYEWVIAKNSDGLIEQYCPEDHYLTEAQKTKLAGIEAGAEVNVQSDWNQTNNTADDYIKNKPTIPTVPSDLLIYNVQTLNSTQQAQARTNIGAGTSSFSGSYNDLSNKPTIIPDASSDNKTYGRKNGAWSEIDTSGGGGGSTISITWSALKSLRDAGTLVPGQLYRITDYVCTTTTTDSRAINNLFDIIVTALDASHLSENASATYHAGDTYFSSNNANLESWQLKYCIDNDTDRFEWVNTTNGKGVIYYMKDNYNNEAPYDFKNIQFYKTIIIGLWSYTFGENEIDNSVVGFYDTGTSKYWFNTNNIIGVYSVKTNQKLKYKLSFNTMGANSCYNKFGNDCHSNSLGFNSCYNKFGDNCYSNRLKGICHSNTFGTYCYSNTFGEYCGSNTFGNECVSNTFGNNCYYNTFGDYCRSNGFYNGTNGTTPKNYIRYIVLEAGCINNKFYSTVSTSVGSYLQRIRIKGLESKTIQINQNEVNTNYDWVIANVMNSMFPVVKQYCPEGTS